MSKIPPAAAKKQAGKIPSSPTTREQPIAFSFKYLNLNSHPKFNTLNCKTGYFEKLVERLNALSSYTAKELQQSVSDALRFHPHKWDHTTEPHGFGLKIPQLEDIPGWQFSISSNEYGRIHGFFLDHIFHLVWLDPNHLLYSKKR